MVGEAGAVREPYKYSSEYTSPVKEEEESHLLKLHETMSLTQTIFLKVLTKSMSK